MKAILLKLYLYWSLFIFTIVMICYLPFLILPYLLGNRVGSKISYFFMRLWAIHFTFPNGGIGFKVHGQEKIKHIRTAIFCANHNSFLDTPAAVWAIPHTLKPLGKAELLKVPIFGLIYRFVTIIVDRKDPESRRKSMIAMKQQLVEGVSMLVFPEGSMNTGSVPMQPFFDGAFRIAVDMQQPIVPIVVVGSAERLRAKGSFNISPGNVHVYILDPIETQGLKAGQVANLREEVRNIMLDEYIKHTQQQDISQHQALA